MSALLPTYARQPVAFTQGNGCTLTDETGREYLDALSGLAVTALGHAHPAVSAAINEQADQLLHTSNLYRIPAQERLGQQLCDRANMEKVFFCNSGTEANEAAIKIARLYGHQRGIDRPIIVVMEGAFHGRTLASLAATANEKIKSGFGPETPGFLRVPYNDTSALVALSDRDDIVAVMMEPAQGEGGVRIPDPAYLDKVRSLCDQQHWLLVLDEIQVGMGRTGRWFAHQHANIKPDVMTLAKALGNGLPIGACLVNGPATELLQPGSHGTTFGGNPFCCHVASRVIDTIENDALVDRAAVLGNTIRSTLHERLHNFPGVEDVRGLGLFIGIELDRPCSDLVARALEHGLLINVTAGQVVRLLPPYIMSDAQAETLCNTLVELIQTFLDDHATEPVSA